VLGLLEFVVLNLVVQVEHDCAGDRVVFLIRGWKLGGFDVGLGFRE